MDIKTISVALVAVMVGAVMFGALIPIFADVTATEDTFTNEGWTRMEKYGTDTEVTVFWDHTKPHQITVDGVVIELPIGSGSEFSMTVVGSPEFLLRYRSTNATIGGVSYFNSTGGYHAGTNDGTDMTLTISNGSVTANNGTSPVTETYTDYVFVVSNDSGGYVMKKPTVESYLNSDSEIYGIGRSQVGASFYSIVMLGTIEDGVTVESPQLSPPTFSDESITYSSVKGHEDLYSFEKITLVATSNGTDYPLTYNQVIVPYEITAERTIQGGDGFNTIVNLIPLIIGMGLVLLTVGWFISRKF